jgi:hypothetical protein
MQPYLKLPPVEQYEAGSTVSHPSEAGSPRMDGVVYGDIIESSSSKDNTDCGFRGELLDQGMYRIRCFKSKVLTVSIFTLKFFWHCLK